jgi:hypothetical protein
MTTIDPPGAPAREQLTGRVLVWADAQFFLNPSDKTGLKLARLSGPRRNHIAEAVPMRVVSTSGKLVEVETLEFDEGENDEGDCAWFDLKPGRDLGPVRLFVRRDDLAPVLTAPFETRFPDGTSIRVARGMPVVPLSDGRYQIALRKMPIAVALPSSSVGHAYRAAPEWISHQHTWSLTTGAPVTLGDDAYATPNKAAYPFRAAAVERRGELALFPLYSRCAEAIVAVPDRFVTPGKEGGSGDLGGWGFGTIGGPDWFVPPDTPLTTTAGRVVTRSRARIAVDRPAAGAKRVCFKRVLLITTNAIWDRPDLTTKHDAGVVQLCAPSSSVARRTGLGHGRVPK